MNERKCLHCSSPVYDQDTLRCWQCGEMLGEKTGFVSALRYTRPRVVFVCIVALICAALLAWFF